MNVKLPKAESTKDQRSKYATILFYANARFGKTNTVRTIVAAGFKPLILATEIGESAGLDTIADLDVPVVKIKNWEEALLVFAELKRRANKEAGTVQYQDHVVNFLVNDSLTGFGDIWKEKGLRVLGWDEIGVPSPGHDTRNIFGYMPEKGHQTMKALMDLPCHLCCFCREGLMEDSTTKLAYPVPELPGQKLNRTLPGWPDATIYGKFLNKDRVILTESEGKVIAGIRMPEGRRFPKFIKPDIGKIALAMKAPDLATFQKLAGELTYTPPAKPSTPGKVAPGKETIQPATVKG